LVLNGTTMGTTYTVKIVAINRIEYDEYKKALKRGIEKILLDINQKMSTFLKDSELSRFNGYRKTDWFSVSKDTAWIIQKSLDISKKSSGAFDITVGPLVNLWGFGPGAKPGIPDNKSIKNRLKMVGYKNISVRLTPPSVKKKIPEMYCDLAAIAKGYGVDKVAEYLTFKHIKSYLVEIGGEIRARGKNHQNQWWKVGVSTPDNKFGIQKILLLKNISMATSGDYWNYFKKEGIRYSHTIDPETGRPVTHKLASVTVIHDSCMIADALATAVNVLGPEKGYELALKENLPAFLLIRVDDRFIEKLTPAFYKILNGN